PHPDRGRHRSVAEPRAHAARRPPRPLRTRCDRSQGRRRRREGRGSIRRDCAAREVMTAVVFASAFADIGDSLREAFFMFWATLWALILGFALSGAVQAFVGKEDLERVLGDHRPGAVARASGFGMVSSSCSYAATAMAKSLFQKGADFVSAM